MKASNGYRASNRYIVPTQEVAATVKMDAYDVVLKLSTDKRTAFHVKMTPREAELLARDLLIAIGRM